MSRTFKFVVNPIAGPKDNLKYWRSLNNCLLSEGIKFKSKITKRQGHATSWATKRVEKETQAVIVSVGGDGTFNEVASVLVNTPLEMAHIPRGSGNGLARMLKIPSALKKIPNYLKNASSQSIDAGTFNDRFFFCTAGFGFDALIAHHFSKSKTRGLKSYIFFSLKSFFKYRGVEAEFEIDGENFSGHFFTVTVANANQFGNNAFIAPSADLQDGWLNVTIIRPFSKILTPLVGLALFTKWIHHFSFVETRKAKKLQIRKVSEPYFHIDGEAIETSLPLEISVLPAALNLLIPKKQKVN